MSVNDAIKDMLYGHEHRWRVAEHELEQARAEAEKADAEVRRLRKLFDDAGQGEHNVLALIDHYQRESLEAYDQRDTARAEAAALREEVEAMRATADKLAELLKGNHVGHGAFPRSGCGVCKPVDAALDALRARKVGG